MVEQDIHEWHTRDETAEASGQAVAHRIGLSHLKAQFLSDVDLTNVSPRQVETTGMVTQDNHKFPSCDEALLYELLPVAQWWSTCRRSAE